MCAGPLASLIYQVNVILKIEFCFQTLYSKLDNRVTIDRFQIYICMCLVFE